MVLVAVIALAWRLCRGPISLDFLIERAEVALDEQLDLLEVEIGHIVLTWTRWSRPLDLRVRDVRVASNGGRDTLVELADMGLMLSGVDLLPGQSAHGRRSGLAEGRSPAQGCIVDGRRLARSRDHQPARQSRADPASRTRH